MTNAQALAVAELAARLADIRPGGTSYYTCAERALRLYRLARQHRRYQETLLSSPDPGEAIARRSAKLEETIRAFGCSSLAIVARPRTIGIESLLRDGPQITQK